MFNTINPTAAFTYDATGPVLILLTFAVIGITLIITGSLIRKKDTLAFGLIFGGLIANLAGILLSYAVMPDDKVEQFQTWTATRYGIVLNTDAAEQLYKGKPVIIDNITVKKIYSNEAEGFILTEETTPVQEVKTTLK